MKEQILKLRNEGKTYKSISKELSCSESLVCYYCGSDQKKKKQERQKRLRKTFLTHLGRRIRFFQTRSDNNKSCNKKLDENSFTVNEFLEKFGEITVCAISGKVIDLRADKNWVLDHKISKKLGGDNSLDNCQVTLKEYNIMKSSFTTEELVEYCKIVLQNKGFKITGNE